MVYRFDGYNYFIRLDKDEHLGPALNQFAQTAKLEGGWVSGLGAAAEATLGFYDLETKEYAWETFRAPLEVISLSGNVTLTEKGEPMWHLHGVLADKSYQTVGGHIKHLIVGATLELFVHRAFQPLQRTFDASVGLQTLDM